MKDKQTRYLSLAKFDIIIPNSVCFLQNINKVLSHFSIELPPVIIAETRKGMEGLEDW